MPGDVIRSVHEGKKGHSGSIVMDLCEEAEHEVAETVSAGLTPRGTLSTHSTLLLKWES